MQKACEAPGCGVVFTAKRATARFHSDACRKRSARAPLKIVSDPVPEVPEAPPPAAPDPGRDRMPSAFAATLKQLDAAGRLDTALGAAALIAAKRLDEVLYSADTGSGVAALLKSHREALAEAVKDAKQEDDPLELIRQSAALKLVSGGSG